MKKTDFERLLLTEDEQLQKLHGIVLKAVEEEKLVSQKLMEFSHEGSNLILCTVAALQAPIIMMSQNLKEEKDRRRSVDDYLINLKAEVEIRNMHEKLDLLIAEE